MTMRSKIEQIYGAKALRKSAINIRDGAGVFEWALAGKGYRTVLEIGTYRGVSAAEMSQFCDRVITIDLKHGRAEQHGETWDRQAFWKSLGAENVELHLVANDAEKARLIAGLEFDFAFVDGAHDETVFKDFDMVKKCGRVLFHDYEPNHKPGHGHVFNLVSGLPSNEVQTKDIFALWTKQ
jgi:predicted O-methyltransferase YrrM